MLLSDATELHALQTQLARARSVTLRFDRIKRSVSGQARALKWEFIGEITVDGSVKLEAEDEEDDRRWFWSSSSASFCSPQQPIFSWTMSGACGAFILWWAVDYHLFYI